MAFSPYEGMCTGFEMGGSPAAVNHNVSMDTINIHTGIYAAKLVSVSGADNAYFGFDVPTGLAQNVCAGMWLDPNGFFAATFDVRIRFMLLGGVGVPSNIDFAIDDNQHLNIIVSGALKATGTIVIPDAYTLIEVKVDTEYDIIQTKINGVLDATCSGFLPLLAGNIYVTTVYAYADGTNSVTFYVDDVSIGTRGFPGDIRYTGVAPDEDTATVEWTMNGAVTSHDCVNEIPADDDTTYLSTIVDDQDFLVKNADFDGSGKLPIFVTLWARTMYMSSNERFKFISKTTAMLNAAESDIYYSAAAYAYKGKLWLRAPDASAWSIARINDVSVGLRSAIS